MFFFFFLLLGRHLFLFHGVGKPKGTPVFWVFGGYLVGGYLLLAFFFFFKGNQKENPSHVEGAPLKNSHPPRARAFAFARCATHSLFLYHDSQSSIWPYHNQKTLLKAGNM